MKTKPKPKQKAQYRNPLAADPSRTAMLRANFSAEFKRRFDRVGREIQQLLLVEDAFGLKAPDPNRFDKVYRTVNRLTINKRWRFLTTTQKVSSFLTWLKSRLGMTVLETYKSQEDGYWKAYVEEGFKKGAGRAFDDTRKAGLVGSKAQLDFYDGSKQEFMRSAFGQPETVEKVKLLAGRVLTDLNDVTENLATRMSRTLTDGLVQGQNPRQIARTMTLDLGVAKNRADVIARTECLTAEALVDSAMVRAVFRRWYDGPMFEIETRSGRKFSATPNHPMLTSKGWIGAGSLQEGDNLVRRCTDQYLSSRGDPNVQCGPTPIGEIFDSLSAVWDAERKLTTQDDFHGDGINGEVDILRSNSALKLGSFSAIDKQVIQSLLPPAQHTQIPLFSLCSSCGGLLPVNQITCLICGTNNNSSISKESLDHIPIAPKLIRERDKRTTGDVFSDQSIGVQIGSELVGDSSVGPSPQLGVGNRPTDPGFSKDTANPLLVSTLLVGDLPLCQAGEIELDDVVSVRVRQFSGHVYNLETGVGYFTIDGGYYTGNTIRAHAEGQLDALERLGVTSVGVAVEWSTAGDDRVCPLCRPLEGVVYKVSEAHGLLPRHPRCRCAFLPANVGESSTQQLKRKGEIEAAIRRSVKAEIGKGSKVSVAQQMKASKWVGADLKADKIRPEPSVRPFEEKAIPIKRVKPTPAQVKELVQEAPEVIKNPEVAVKQAVETVTHYHGTLKNNVDNILKEGISPNAAKRFVESAQGERGAKVFTTSNKAAAEWYGKSAALYSEPGSEFAVFEIQVPVEALKQALVDTSLVDSWMFDKIPPEWIKVVHPGKVLGNTESAKRYVPLVFDSPSNRKR